MVERAEESAPLRAIDWRKMRLSKGEYCVEIEGIPCSNAEILKSSRSTGSRPGARARARPRMISSAANPPKHGLYEDSDASSKAAQDLTGLG
jgi:hypothetical protein